MAFFTSSVYLEIHSQQIKSQPIQLKGFFSAFFCDQVCLSPKIASSKQLKQFCISLGINEISSVGDFVQAKFEACSCKRCVPSKQVKQKKFVSAEGLEKRRSISNVI